jgi:F-type H+-transporting ATPase subunit a
MPDPIHQFEIHRIIPLKLFGYDVSFTISALFMLVAVVLSAGLLIYAMRDGSLVPRRLQSTAEIGYEFIANMVRDAAGEQGMKYFPLIFTIFAFVFTCNMLGIIPGAFTVTSHIVITAALAALVFLTVLIVGFAKNGVHFLKLFVPSGVPIYILPLVTAIEIISFLSASSSCCSAPARSQRWRRCRSSAPWR